MASTTFAAGALLDAGSGPVCTCHRNFSAWACYRIQAHRDFLRRRCFSYCLHRASRVAADEFEHSIHHHLWCIHAATQLRRVPVLSLAVRSRRKRIFPADVIPIIHMLTQCDDLRAPATGCDASSFRNSSSAGGQLEQPSEVNSSTSTGERVPSALAVCVCRLRAPVGDGRQYKDRRENQCACQNCASHVDHLHRVSSRGLRTALNRWMARSQRSFIGENCIEFAALTRPRDFAMVHYVSCEDTN